MMALLIPLFSLLRLNNWAAISSVLIILSLFALPMNSNPFGLSTMTMSDSMSSCLMILSLWITALMLLASMKIQINNWNPCHFSLMVCSLALILVLCFSVSNILIFYVLFEASLIPTMILISMWGYQPERLQASLYLMLYTVSASLPLLMALMSWTSFTDNYSMLFPWLDDAWDNQNDTAAWMCLIVAFLVKLPMFSVHLWLPKAHVEAPIAGSMILAAVLLKLGGYGLLRMIYFIEPMPEPLMVIAAISLIGGLIASLICIRQTDMKSLIAYSSVSHMGLLIGGTAALNNLGSGAALGMMLAHGFSSSGLFCLANMTYDSSHSRSILLNKGILHLAPQLSLMWFLFCAINMACPPSVNLLSEILLLLSASPMTYMFTILMTGTSFFTAAYSMVLYSSANHGFQLLQSKPLFMQSNHLNLTIMGLHLWPALLLVSKPELITFWL